MNLSSTTNNEADLGRNHWEYFQPNPKDKRNNAGDCVVRALCYVTGMNWYDVFNELVKISLKKCRMPNDPLVYNKFLSDRGFIKQGFGKPKEGKKRPIVETFNAFEGHEEDPIILVCASHIVAYQNHVYYDSWDSGWKSVYTTYVKS